MKLKNNKFEFHFTVDFTTNNAGNRELDCSVNSKQDASNICECDKRFALNIAATQESCASDASSADDEHGDFCMDEQYRTTNGGGKFDPRQQCEKQFHGHDKDKCCGVYPNRYPYDSDHKDCCQMQQFDEQGESFLDFILQPANGRCEQEGGTVVVSVEGEPHTYQNANQD